MTDLIVEPHLIELIRTMDSAGFSLIVAGGLGLHLKRRWVASQVREYGRKNLIPVVPQARTTLDIDVFLAIEVFLLPPEDGVTRFRRTLESLHYTVHARAAYFQFSKPCGDRLIKLDLHTRLPDTAEAELKYNPPRVGRKQQPPHPLHAYGTPEAFAIEEHPQKVPLVGNDPDGHPFAGTVQIPHPFAALCMKIQAALDHERTPLADRRPVDQKHAFDVYLLLAMLDREEYDETTRMLRTFADRPELLAIQAGVKDIFGSAEAPGCRTIELQARVLDDPPLDLPRFSVLLNELLAAR